MVSKMASTPLGGMILRSSSKTNTPSGGMILRSSTKTNTPSGGRFLRSSMKTNTLVPAFAHEGSPASVSKKSSKQKADKISGTINREGEDECEELHGTVLLKVRITLHYVYEI